MYSAPTHPYRRRRRSRRRSPLRFAVAVPLVLALITAIGLFFATRPKVAPILEDEEITQALLPVNPYSRPGTPLKKINGIVVHYVGNPGTTAQQNRDYFASLADTHDTHASSHFIIGIDGEILQCIPLDEIAYCSNDRNDDTISIECCHPGEDGKFTEATRTSLIRLLRRLAQDCHLSEDDIIRHYDVTGKLCPKYYVEHPDAWEALKRDVF